MMASWQQWLAKGDVKTHQTSKQEIDNLRALITRDLADAAVTGLSADRQFAIAYNAALQSGHHKVTFELAALAIGAKAIALSDYFDACRRKRNVIDYMTSSVATETEAEEIVRKAQEFQVIVETWAKNAHPILF
jgi:hypothetical protein